MKAIAIGNAHGFLYAIEFLENPIESIWSGLLSPNPFIRLVIIFRGRNGTQYTGKVACGVFKFALYGPNRDELRGVIHPC